MDSDVAAVTARGCVAGWGGAVGGAARPARRGILIEFTAVFIRIPPAMIELNPIRQRIADLQERLLSLRGYL